jgi:uncharacterized repeat protein (TIGR02543 family)
MLKIETRKDGMRLAALMISFLLFVSIFPDMAYAEIIASSRADTNDVIAADTIVVASIAGIANVAEAIGIAKASDGTAETIITTIGATVANSDIIADEEIPTDSEITPPEVIPTDLAITTIETTPSNPAITTPPEVILTDSAISTAESITTNSKITTIGATTANSNIKAADEILTNPAITTAEAITTDSAITTFTVTFSALGGSVTPASIEVVSGEAIETLPSPTKTGYTFVGWCKDAALTQDYIASNPVTENIELYANWNIAQFKADFDANGGKGVTPATITKDYNSEIGTLPNVSRIGYTFKGWYTTKSGGTKISINTKVPAKDVKYYAQWKINKYKATFNANGSSASKYPKIITKDYNAKLGTLPKISRTGYTFKGWYTTKSGGTKISVNTKVPAKDVKYYAHWKINKYKATFGANGSSASKYPKIITKDYNAKLGALPKISRTGYTFKGWYTAKSGGTKISVNTKVPAKDVNYYAHWKINKYKATFNANGSGTSTYTKIITKNYKSKIGTLPKILRTGYTFNGWYTKKSGGTKINAARKVPAKNVTYYGHWTIKKYNLYFNANGGESAPAARTVKHFQKIGAMAGSPRLSYTFVGWFTDPMYGVEVTSDTTLTKNTTVYAHWSRPADYWMYPTGGPNYPNLNVPDLNVEVNVSQQIVYIKSGSTVLHRMLCSTGKVATPTPLGFYTLQAEQGAYFNAAKYWRSFLGHGIYLFHTVCTTSPNGAFDPVEGAKLGTRASHGCIRLSVPDAYWFYANMPYGTTIWIHE